MILLVYRDNEIIHELSLKPGGAYKVGRQQGSDIQLDKIPGISRNHLEIVGDHSGHWRVEVLSNVKFIEVDGEERQNLDLVDEGEFTLGPYLFKYSLKDSPSENFSSERGKIPNNSFSPTESFPMGDDSITDEMSFTRSRKTPEDFQGDDEKTSIHGFSGLPYIKILGQDGKKSEYFRLEGNLWVVGGNEGASVYLRDASASPSHFEISKTDKGFFIVDLNSTSGTYLNGQKLTSQRPSRLLSGDIITVGGTSLQFELRDKAFKRKVSNIPLNMYKNPLVFFDQEVAMVSLDEPATEEGRVESINMSGGVDGLKQNPLRLALIGVIVVIGLYVGYTELNGENEQTKKQVVGADPYSQLTPAEQKLVQQTYTLAQQLYLNKNYELALVQLDKLHTIIPVYKKSKEMEEYCVNARDVQRQQALIERQKKEREQLEAQVNSLLTQCESQFSQSDDVEGAKACLIPATDLDPNNPRISQLIGEVTARLEEQKIREKIAADRADKVRRGKELYERALALHKKQQWLKAVEAYENHIHSGLPDPSHLVKKSKRSLAAIEWTINDKKDKLMGQAFSKYENALKESIVLARQAQEVDPYDPKISTFLFKAEKELKNKMKVIYMDSLLEERFGNLESSRLKWEEILQKDVDNGEYYLKAKRKLKEYGYKY